MISIERLGIWGRVPQFNFPKKEYCHAFPIVYDIVMSLSERDFNIPGVDVTFSLTDDNQYKNLFILKFPERDIELYFLHIQGSLIPGVLNDTAGLTTCNIKGYSADFQSWGNYFFTYTGNDWKKDKEKFRSMLYADQKQENRIYSPFLECEECDAYNQELAALLTHICSFPTTESREFTNSFCENKEDFSRRHFDPYPDNYPSLFFSEEYKRDIVSKFQLNDPEQVCIRQSSRLVSLCTGNKDIEISPIANDGFIWDNTEKIIQESKEYKNYKIMIAECRPHYLDEIYVAEMAIAEDYRQECFKDSRLLSDAQYNKYCRLCGVKVVLLKEYMESQMEFRQPQILVRKSICYDEVIKLHVIDDGNHTVLTH